MLGWLEIDHNVLCILQLLCDFYLPSMVKIVEFSRDNAVSNFHEQPKLFKKFYVWTVLILLRVVIQLPRNKSRSTQLAALEVVSAPHS